MVDVPRPQRAIDFLTKKIKVETESWDDLKCGEHAHAMTVAHSANTGVLDEIHRLLNDAVEKGTSFQDFRNGMLDMMKKTGWYGGVDLPEIADGDTKKERQTKRDKREQYINWRIGVIYDTNMKTAYAQAAYRDQLQGAALRPIWVYQSHFNKYKNLSKETLAQVQANYRNSMDKTHLSKSEFKTLIKNRL